ncbi:MAG: hypothetical protein ACK5NA_07660 [Enterococcus sp.]
MLEVFEVVSPMITIDLFIVYCIFSLTILQKNNDRTRRDIQQLREELNQILKELRKDK